MILLPALPYFSVLIGMFLFHSAWFAILLYHLGIVSFLIWKKPSGLWGRMFRGAKGPFLLSGIILCALAAPAIFWLWSWLVHPSVSLAEWLAQVGLVGWKWVLFIPYFSLIHPLLEEAFWRELSRTKKAKRICTEDLLFAGYHLLVLSELLNGFALGFVFFGLVGTSFVWRQMAIQQKGYGFSLITHIVADASILIGVVFLLR